MMQTIQAKHRGRWVDVLEASDCYEARRRVLVHARAWPGTWFRYVDYGGRWQRVRFNEDSPGSYSGFHEMRVY